MSVGSCGCPVRARSAARAGFSRPNIVYCAYANDEPEEQLILKAKWKRAPWMGEGINNSPRREIGAYAAQKLFLQPWEYVVPPTLGLVIVPA